MDKKEFGSIMKELSIVYGGRKFPISEDVLNTWSEYLTPYPYDLTKRAVKEHVQESTFAPSIADIIKRVKEYEQERKKVVKECQEMVELTMDLYPGSKNRGKVMELTAAMTGWDKPEVAKLCARIRMLIKEIETGAKSGKIVAFLPLDDLLEGWSNESGS